MESFGVMCYIDTDLINQKVQTGIVRGIRDEVKDVVKETVREEVKNYLLKFDFEKIIKEVYYEESRREVSELLYRLRRDDYDRFRWNGKEVDPSPERMFKLITAYVGQLELMESDDFKEHVLDKTACDISDRIVKNFGKNRAYKKTVEAIKEGFEENL